MQQGLPPANAAALRKARDRLNVHLDADLRELRYVLDKYNLTSQSLAVVLEQLEKLDGEYEAEERGISEGSSEGSSGENGPDEVE